jgi:hypothetical protein
MKKHIYSVIALAVFATSAFASSLAELNVKVPFDFKAGASTLPAGTYRVTETSSGYILIRGEKGGVFVLKNTVLVDTDESGKTSFKFDRTGDHYVLEAVHSEK